MISAVLAILCALNAEPDISGQWQRWFAVWPVTVDAYDDSEIKNGKFSYSKWGWVDRRWYTWTDEEMGESYAYWRYRLVPEVRR